MKSYDWIDPRFAETALGKLHLAAIERPSASNGEKPIVDMLKGWCNYAHLHPELDGSIQGKMWAHVGANLRRLICTHEPPVDNGGADRLDLITLALIINSNLREAGFDPDTL